MTIANTFCPAENPLRLPLERSTVTSMRYR
jgi:hypothetical protein